jgi:L,D-transpeptidase ErfK/SrfK
MGIAHVQVAMRKICLRGVALLLVAAAPGIPQEVRGSEPVAVTGGVAVYTVVKGDTLQYVSARFGTDPAVIAADNGLKPNAMLQVGQTLRIDNRHIVPAVEHATIVINVPQRMLFYVGEGETRGMPVAVGQSGWRTPTQPFTVATRETDPSWEVPKSIQAEARRAGKTLPSVVPPGPNNPLGKYWLGLSIPSVGIHGTNAPSSIYRVTTHGCIRVGTEDIAWLHARVTVGTPGAIVYEPILVAVVGGDVFLEVHRDVYGRLDTTPIALVRRLVAAAGVEQHVDWAAAERVIRARDGIARSIAAPGGPG